MLKVVDTLNTFARNGQQDAVQPSEEQIFVLTSSQLQDIVSRAIQEATETLYREIALDRQRIAKLERKEPQPLQKDRGEILRALIAANGGKMLRSQARKRMHLSEQTFTNLLATVNEIDSLPYRTNKRQKLLVLKYYNCNM